jgi:2-oxoglutarate dehydrogenase E2 component (dihydrolipoamide succinyltransferase)
MLIDVVVPEVGESIHEVQVLAWKKQPGDQVQKDEELVEIETEKATVPVIASASGRLAEVAKKDGEFAEVGDTLARIETSTEAPGGTPDRPSKRAAAAAAEAGQEAVAAPRAEQATPVEGPKPSPKPAAKPKAARPKSQPAAESSQEPETASQAEPRALAATNGKESRVPMSLLRQTIARRLVEAQRNAALVTTYNEVDMHEVMDLRREFGESFKAAFDVKLGFMSFFVKAAVEGLRRCPEINARIEGRDIVYQNYYDIGVAIGSGRGLVVPVLRHCERLSFAEIEHQIAEYAEKVQQGRISPHDLEGGTFTISNGGVYGSLLSTPIVNPPQSGVLGLHAIQERPVARDGQVVIRPMMYIALTYDHRLVDGREAVTFLRRIKEVIETPARLFLEV